MTRHLTKEQQLLLETINVLGALNSTEETTEEMLNVIGNLSREIGDYFNQTEISLIVDRSTGKSRLQVG